MNTREKEGVGIGISPGESAWHTETMYSRTNLHLSELVQAVQGGYLVRFG